MNVHKCFADRKESLKYLQKYIVKKIHTNTTGNGDIMTTANHSKIYLSIYPIYMVATVFIVVTWKLGQMIVQFVIHIRLEFAYASFIYFILFYSFRSTLIQSVRKKSEINRQTGNIYASRKRNIWGAFCGWLWLLNFTPLFFIECHGINAHQNAQLFTSWIFVLIAFNLSQ